jgi:hypothetical protein
VGDVRQVRVREGRPINIFVAECYWPGITAGRFAAVERGIRAACAEARGSGEVVHVASLLFPEDEVVFALFRARSAAEVVEIGERAGLPVERVSQSVLDVPGPAQVAETGGVQ